MQRLEVGVLHRDGLGLGLGGQVGLDGEVEISE